MKKQLFAFISGFNKKGLPIMLIFCHIFTLVSCYTTHKVYDERVIETTYTLLDANIISHQNNIGVLYYTVEPVYANPVAGILVPASLAVEEFVAYKLLTNYEFPFSTYSDAVQYKNEHTFPAEITVRENKKELVKSERVFRPVRTGLAIGLPALGILLVILASVFAPDTSENK
jgi:hypothetical protein